MMMRLPIRRRRHHHDDHHHRHVVTQHSTNSSEAPSATPRLLPFPAWFQLRRRSVTGCAIATVVTSREGMGIFPGSVKAKFGSHQFTHRGVDHASLYLGITDRDDFAVCQRRSCLARSWTGGKRMRDSASPRQRSERSDRGRRPGASFRTGAALPGVSGFYHSGRQPFVGR